MELANGTEEQKRMAQDALNRWGWPSLMMFGPPDDKSPNTERSMRWRIKRETNDELRQTYLNQIVPELQALGLQIPDPDLHYDQTSSNWISGPIDWDEFWRVIAGQGPCNRERLEARRQAHEDGQWVREALAEYAHKQTNRIASG